MERVLVDTGFLVALGRARDPLHEAARTYLEGCTLGLATVTAVVVETCYFLGLSSRRALLEWLADEGPAVVEVPPEAYPELARTMERYKERDIDFADAALVWLAEQTGHRTILTVDEADFRRFRLKGGGRFELVEWR
jgi:predicted nucleic acid-binding protein